VQPPAMPSPARGILWPAWLLGAGLVALVVVIGLRPPAGGTGQRSTATGTPAGTSDPVALDHALRGRHFFQRRAEGDLLRAQRHFEQAIARQPDLVDAHAGLAGVYFIRLTEGSIDRDTGVRKLGEAAQRALALDPQHPEARLRARNHAFALGQPAAPVGPTPAQVAPDSPLGLTQRAIEATRAGRAGDAVELLRRVVRQEPLSAVARTALAHGLYVAGQLDEAEQSSLEAAELSGGGIPDVAARVMLLQGRLQAAADLSATWPDGPQRRQFMALLHTAKDDEAAAQAALRALIDSDGRRDPLLVAEVHAWRGEHEEALDWLRAFERTRADPVLRVRATVQPWMIGSSPLATSLREDPRFVRWLRSYD
jgi:tetratricopeptide (TPR) repeat protein